MFAVNRLVWLAFHGGVVVAVASGTHAGDELVSVQQRAMLVRAILAVSVCMMTPRGVLRWSGTMHSASHTSDAGMRSLIDKQGRSVFEFLCASIGSRSGSSAARPSLLPRQEGAAST